MRVCRSEPTKFQSESGGDANRADTCASAGRHVQLQPDTPGSALLPCRSLFLVYDSSGAVAGVPTFRFVPSSMVFANTSVNPANAGFCVPAGNCPGTGVLNVSVCKQGMARGPGACPGTLRACSSTRASSLLSEHLRAGRSSKASPRPAWPLFFADDSVFSHSRCSNISVSSTFLPGGSKVCRGHRGHASQKRVP